MTIIKDPIANITQQFEESFLEHSFEESVIHEHWNNTFKSSQCTITQTTSLYHDEWFLKAWKLYLEEYTPNEDPIIYLCSTFRNPECFYTYPLDQETYFNSYDQYIHAPCKQDLLDLKKQLNGYDALPISLIQFCGFNHQLVSEISEHLNQTSELPSLILIETEVNSLGISSPSLIKTIEELKKLAEATEVRLHILVKA